MSFDVKTRLSKLKSSAKARGINVNLDVNKYQALIDIGCHFCGTSLEKENGYCLDRVDSSLPYTISNVVGCCKICNRAKSDMKVWDFINWLKKASEHNQKQVQAAREIQDLGVTQEMFELISQELFNQMNQQSPKLRVKEVYSGSK